MVTIWSEDAGINDATGDTTPGGVEVLMLDNMVVKVHPDAAGALKRIGPQAIGRSRGGGVTTKVHVAASGVGEV